MHIIMYMYEHSIWVPKPIHVMQDIYTQLSSDANAYKAQCINLIDTSFGQLQTKALDD